MSSLPFPITAFLAGIVSFLSPCVLPLVPGYVSLISGASVEELQSKDRKLLNTVLLHSLMFILGLHLTGILKIKALYADKRLHSVQGGKSPLGAFVVGFAFAFGWTPCLGPIISAILIMAGSAETVTKGVLLLWVYSLGLAVPFLLTSLLIDRFLSFYGRFRKHLHTLEVGSGVLLMVLGVLILTRRFTVLSSYLGFLNRFTW